MNTIDEMDIEVPTVYASDYLTSENGKKALRLFSEWVKELGEKRAKEEGWNYSVAHELYIGLSERLPHSLHFDIALKDTIMDADPKDIAECWKDWVNSDYSGNILGTDNEEYYTEVKASFDKWAIDDEFGDENGLCVW